MTVDELRRELEQEARTTRRVLEPVPEDRLTWKPHPRSMSMGQLAMHVASLPGEIAKISTQASFDVDTPIPRPEATSRGTTIARSSRCTCGSRGPRYPRSTARARTRTP